MHDARRAGRACVFFAAVTSVSSVLAQAPPATLTLHDAQAMALKNHPQVLAAENEMGYANQEVIEARSAYFPMVSAAVTGSQANRLARIGVGFLPSSRLFSRLGQGVTFSQLITDAGRTTNLVASSRLGAQAASQNYRATRYDVLLDVSRSYFSVLHARSVVRVAEATVAARELLLDQVSSLAKNNLRSQLDVSFAEVNVSEAKLLLIRAQASVEEALAELCRRLGSSEPGNYELADEPLPPSPPEKPGDLIAQAMSHRPELSSLRYSRDAAFKFAEAEKDLNRPAVSLTGVAGFLPLVNEPRIPSEYEGVALNVQVPLFNGRLFSARHEAATYRAVQADQKLREAQDRVARDVRVAWARAMTAYQRLDVTAQYLRQASLALDLAQGRYSLGLCSIVELTQAQLNVTQAEIENISSKYDYQSQNAALQYAAGLLR